MAERPKGGGGSKPITLDCNLYTRDEKGNPLMIPAGKPVTLTDEDIKRNPMLHPKAVAERMARNEKLAKKAAEEAEE